MKKEPSYWETSNIFLCFQVFSKHYFFRILRQQNRECGFLGKFIALEEMRKKLMKIVRNLNGDQSWKKK